MYLYGEFNTVLDDRNRIMLPAQLRKNLEGTTFILTKGQDSCLWLYTPEKYEELIGMTIKENTDPFSTKDRRIMRKFIGTSQTIDIDKAGRILIPEKLRDYAGISKDCVILGQYNYIEIWDDKRYRDYSNENDEENAKEYFSAFEELSQRIKRKKGID